MCIVRIVCTVCIVRSVPMYSACSGYAVCGRRDVLCI